MKAKSITVLKVEPGKVPTVAKLKTGLEQLQKAVSEGCDRQGLIEIIPIAEGVCILCNEEGKLWGLPGNRRIGKDIIVGTFYIIGENEEGELISLTDKQLLFYNAMFAIPEVLTDDEIEASLFFEVTDGWET